MNQNKVTLTFFSLKSFLFLVAIIYAVAAIVLIISYTSAATVGKAPSVPISLTDGVNTGILGPGEQRWFKFVQAGSEQTAQVEQSLTLFFTPGDGNQARHVSLQLFEENQLPLFYFGDATKMTNFGAGQVISRDNNPETGELFWTGWVFKQNDYYIQLMNGSQEAIDYWLFTDNIISYPLGESEGQQNVEPEVGSAPTVTEGRSPQTALPLQFSQNKGRLNPGQEIWYSFSIADLDGELFEEMVLTMIATPNDRNQIQRLNFDVFTSREVQYWSPGNNSQINNVGAGSLVQRDNDSLTGERFWTGWVVDGDLYYVQIRNGADVQMDYWLFTDDIYNRELGEISN